MKIAYLLAVLLVVFMVGCATTPTEEATGEETTGGEATGEETTGGEATGEETTGGEAPVGADVTFNGRGGYDPETITIAAGSTLSVMVRDDTSAQYSFRVQETGETANQVKDGEMAELAFEEAGSYTVMSVPLMKKLTVTVE